MGVHYGQSWLLWKQLRALWGTFYRLLLTGVLPGVAFPATAEYCSACLQRLNSHSSTGRPPSSLLVPSFYLAAHQEDRTALISLTMWSPPDILLETGPGSSPWHWTWRVGARQIKRQALGIRVSIMSDKCSFVNKIRWGLGELKEAWGDKGAKGRSPASGIIQAIILLKANNSKNCLLVSVEPS